jgi:hypothetical protein
MVNVVGSRDDFSRWKPKGFENHKTAREVADLVGRDKSRLFQLEREGRIPSPIRVKVGRHKVRLYSEAECAKIKEVFSEIEGR